MEGLRSNCESTPALRAKSSEVPQKLPTYRKMRLKSIARISEWEVEINQGITGMRNPGIPGNFRGFRVTVVRLTTGQHGIFLEPYKF
jgi:hypothetical protein